MAIIRWSPFKDFDKFFEEDFIPMIPFRVSEPAIDVYEDEGNIYIDMPLAGVDPEKVDISIENDILTARGEIEKKEEVKKENFYRKEIKRGAFERSVRLPIDVKGEEARAEYDKGMLKISIPKAEKAKPKKVTVNVLKR